MGFTVYWEPIHPVSQGVWDTFVRRALHLIKKRRTGKVQLDTKLWDPKNYTKNIKVKNVFLFSGTEEEGGETFTVCKDESELSKYTWVKTNRNPYTFDVYVCLILMYDLGMLRWFGSDDELGQFYPKALAYVKKNFALKHSYEKLERMSEWEDEHGVHKTPSPVKMKERKPRKKTVKSARTLRAERRAKTMKN
jgi:hypothetical protein